MFSPENWPSIQGKVSRVLRFENIAFYLCWYLDTSEGRLHTQSLRSYEMWRWRRMEKISWSDHMRNRNITKSKDWQDTLHTIKKRKANLIGHIWRRNYFLQHATERKTEGRTEVAGRRLRRYKQLLDDLKETREYWKLKEEALYCTLWRTRVGRCYGPTVIQTEEWMKHLFP